MAQLLNYVLFGKNGAGFELIFRILMGAPMPQQHATQYTVPVYIYLNGMLLEIYKKLLYGSNEARSAHYLFKILDKTYFVINFLPCLLPTFT